MPSAINRQGPQKRWTETVLVPQLDCWQREPEQPRAPAVLEMYVEQLAAGNDLDPHGQRHGHEHREGDARRHAKPDAEGVELRNEHVRPPRCGVKHRLVHRVTSAVSNASVASS